MASIRPLPRLLWGLPGIPRRCSMSPQVICKEGPRAGVRVGLRRRFGSTETTTTTTTTAHPESLLRFDRITGTWVVYSSGRSNRPRQTDASHPKTKLDDLPRHVADCPFCAGNEHLTPQPPKLMREGLRVIDNKYPAVAPLQHHPQQPQHQQTQYKKYVPSSSSQLFLHDEDSASLINQQIPAVGFHEVVVESPYHNAHIATEHGHTMAYNLLKAFRDRGQDHRMSKDIEHTVFFKNHGPTAGASLIHPHSQIVSTPVVPVEAERLQSLAWQYFKRHRQSLYERVVHEEMDAWQQAATGTAHKDGDQEKDPSCRLVDVTENFVALVPFASPGPYVIRILPRFQAVGTGGSLSGGPAALDSSDFTTLTDDLLEECALLLQSCLRRLYILLADPDFNLVVQTAPVPQRGVQAAIHAAAFFRWHMQITPRLGAGAMAGFELGSGFFSNTHLPEEDALRLRQVLPLLSSK